MLGRPTNLTDHAIRRYIERHCKGWSYHDASKELAREMDRATLHEQPPGEDSIWTTPRGCLLVVSLDGTVRTVLPAGSRATNRRPKK